MTSSSLSYRFPARAFLSLGTENNPMVPNQENMEGDQSVQSHNHAQRTLQPETCEQQHCTDEAFSFPGRFDLIACRSPLSNLAQYSP